MSLPWMMANRLICEDRRKFHIGAVEQELLPLILQHVFFLGVGDLKKNKTQNKTASS